METGGVELNEVQVGSKAACPLIANVDTSHTSLKTVLEAMEKRVLISPEVDLSETGSTEIVFVADRAYTVTAMKLAYTEASSADVGKAITVGKLIVGTDDADYFVTTVNTEASKEAGYIKELTLVKTAVAAGDIITFTSAGGKTGTGKAVLVVELSKA
jgi:hypothetical protein